jgi:hypothetical protein
LRHKKIIKAAQKPSLVNPSKPHKNHRWQNRQSHKKLAGLLL